METLAQALERLAAAGFTAHFRATERGLAAAGSGRSYEPESLEIAEVVRFEGPTDPADESILFALRCREDGVRGTYAVAYGPGMDPLDAEMVLRLGAPRRGGRAP
jgi:hypothetical protein